MTYTIRYRRPGAPWSIVIMEVPGGTDHANTQINRLRTLGYTIVDISPPLPETASTNATAPPLDEAT